MGSSCRGDEDEAGRDEVASVSMRTDDGRSEDLQDGAIAKVGLENHYHGFWLMTIKQTMFYIDCVGCGTSFIPRRELNPTSVLVQLNTNTAPTMVMVTNEEGLHNRDSSPFRPLCKDKSFYGMGENQMMLFLTSQI